jgi:ABC-type multidrug transport system fused ATPase/permease subunit
MINHRLSTVTECDLIILLNKGEIKGQGTSEELVDNNDNFKAQSSEL